MKREVLFEGVRDRDGDLFLEVSGANVATYMGRKFWEGIVRHFNKKHLEYFDARDRTAVKQKLEIIRKALE